MYTFFVSSAIETDRGIFSHDEREEQTIETIRSINRNVPNAKIIIYECGATLANDRLERLSKEALIVPLQNIPQLRELSSHRLNSHAEAYATHMMMMNALQFMDANTKRIFKLSGRYKLQDSFDISAYDNVGEKFVFKKRVKTWMEQNQQDFFGIDSLFDTRLYSLTPALTKYYADCLVNVYDDLNLGIDFEHSIFKNIDKSLVVEFDKVHCEGKIAPDGSTKID